MPVVRPGYIPRESDYAPSVTLTHREAPAPAAPKAAAAITPPGDGIDAITGARPTVSGTEPPAPAAPASAAPTATPAPKAGDPPVRPDVEPPEEAAAATAKSR